MKESRFPGVMAVTVLLVLAGFIAVTYGRLPERFAVHWDAQGVPNGWQDRAGFLKTFAGIAFFMNLTFVASLVFLRRMPASMINIPYKKIWFSTPELRETAYHKLTVILFSAWVFSNLLFLLSYYSIYQEAVPGALLKIPITVVGLAVPLLAVLSLLGLIFYTRPPRVQQPSG